MSLKSMLSEKVAKLKTLVDEIVSDIDMYDGKAKMRQELNDALSGKKMKSEGNK